MELKQQAEKLLAEAESMRRKEIVDAIADVKQKIRLYGLTAEQLGLARNAGAQVKKRGPTTTKKSAAPAAIRYRGPNGETWSGGRGRKPRWVVDALASGKKLEEFAVQPG
ncbi:H-NS histone family protein [Ramlibacter sp. XY19]|uniref:H-NS histone family protein n=1 Tax=Ramlibacter paludis TaxID=2908000 RepID=UPI0023DCCADF|nr:H-NS histone family protein [Ramlibacter paludis]MCG2592032.1 H-NS histone family protein [Ramlibacter paludis]